MAPRTQLDALVGVLESRQDWLARTHAHTLQALAASREAEVCLLERIALEKPAAATADEWRASEQRVERLRLELHGQQDTTRRCSEDEAAAKASLTAAHRRVETLRKASDRIRAGIMRARDKAESREHDELALLRFQHAG